MVKALFLAAVFGLVGCGGAVDGSRDSVVQGDAPAVEVDAAPSPDGAPSASEAAVGVDGALDAGVASEVVTDAGDAANCYNAAGLWICDGGYPVLDAGVGDSGYCLTHYCGDAAPDAGPTPCTVGETRCAGNAVETCLPAGPNDWSSPTVCDAGCDSTRCDGGACCAR